MMIEFKAFIGTEFISKYEKSINEKFNIILKHLNDDFSEMTNKYQREEKMINIRRRCIDTRKRWVKALGDKYQKAIEEEIHTVFHEYNRVLSGEENKKDFKDYFGVDNPNDYKDLRVERIASWKENQSSLLTDFPYIHLIPKRSLKAAYKNDILIMFYGYICDYEEKSQLTKVPTIFSNILVDTTNRATIYSKGDIKTLEKYTDIGAIKPIEMEIMAEPEAIDKVILELEQKSYLELKNGNPIEAINFATELALIKALRYMNALDVALCVYYYNFRNVVNDEEILTSVYAVAEDMGLSHSEKSHNDLIESHIKLSSSNLKGTISGIGDEKFSINGSLLECVIYEENKIKMVKVKLGGLLKEMVMKRSAFEYSKDLYNSFSKDAKQISTWLQMRRYKAYLNNESLETSCNLASTTFGIYWRGSRLDRKRKRVVDALEEMKAKNHIVEDYDYNKKNQVLTIYFRHLNENDKKILKSNGVSVEGQVLNLK